MRLGKEIYNLQGRRNKRQSNGAMFEMMTSKMTIDLNVLSSLMKNRVMSNLNRTLVVTIHRSSVAMSQSHKLITLTSNTTHKIV
jgi:hypothetical protein